jgi:hypothetical protein
MNKRQRAIIINFATVIIATALAVTAMIYVKGWVNRSEAMRAMKHLSEIVLQYQKDNGSVPAESHIDRIKEDLEGSARLGNLNYRARWIEPDSSPDEILAYTRRDYPTFAGGSGAIVLRLDGRVEWMGKEAFEPLLASQQKPLEIELLQK